MDYFWYDFTESTLNRPSAVHPFFSRTSPLHKCAGRVRCLTVAATTMTRPRKSTWLRRGFGRLQRNSPQVSGADSDSNARPVPVPGSQVREDRDDRNGTHRTLDAVHSTSATELCRPQ